MRTRFALVIVAIAAVASACGSSSPSATGTTGTTTPAVPTPSISIPAGVGLDCAKYVHTSQQISQATSKMFTGTVADFTTAMNVLKAEFAALKDGAPSDVKAALDDMTSAMTDIGKIRANPSSADQSHLQTLAQKMPLDGQKIAAYIATKCH
ncbi:MAG: hypothetical protein JWR52_2430 [Marmoricola sp.]|nr:hypothetical protein [Marmoricola sp.]